VEGPADAALLEFLHQRRFVEARRRLGECCSGSRDFSVSFCPASSGGSLCFQLLVFFVLRVFRLLVHLEEAVELRN